MLEKIIAEIESLIMDMPDSSNYSYDQGWNEALRKVLEIIKKYLAEK